MINQYSKQSLRQLMSLMLFCSAVLLTACGGGGETESTTATETSTKEETTTYSVDSSSDATQEAYVSRDTGTLSGTLDDYLILTNDTDLQDTNSVNTQSTDLNSDMNVISGTYTASIQWSAPDQRENGGALNLYEIAGYEIQYRKVGAPNFTVVRVAEDGTGSQSIDIEVSVDSDYELLIASYDIDGLYSEYYQTRIEDIASVLSGG